jgi:predicted DNA binding protein
LNRGDLLHDLRETVRQLAEAVGIDDTPARSVKTIVRERGTRRLSNRLTDEQVRELVAAFESGSTRMELAERYGIGRTSVAKLLRAWRDSKSEEGAA